uniref:FH2 domain-containing protein n=1 Tax=Rodentolepis nana TaxID=102285 RepID=A0A0R3TNA3_RODNA
LEDRELVCLLLEDYLPKVYIEGVDYLGNLPEDAKQRVLALAPPEKIPLLTEKEEEQMDEDVPVRYSSSK